MESALIVTSTEKGFAAINELLRAQSVINSVMSRSCGEGRRKLLERGFDFVIISAPLPDENGESLARQIAANEASQVILLVKSELYDEVSAVCGADGVLTVEKPVNRDVFRQAVNMARAMRAKLIKANMENEDLRQRIDNIRIIDRAKNILISSAGMSEHEAHRYIEKKAMDTRTSKRAVSERIINDYENGPEA